MIFSSTANTAVTLVKVAMITSGCGEKVEDGTQYLEEL